MIHVVGLVFCFVRMSLLGVIVIKVFWTCTLSPLLLISPNWRHPQWSILRNCRLPALRLIFPNWHHPTWKNFRIRRLSISWLILPGWSFHWWNTFLNRRLFSIVTFFCRVGKIQGATPSEFVCCSSLWLFWLSGADMLLPGRCGDVPFVLYNFR